MEARLQHLEPDEILMVSLSEGSQQAFSTLYLKYHDGLFRYLLKFTKNHALTEDLVQDIFIKIWERRNKIEIKSSFASYLFRFARNTAVNQLRRLALHQNYQEEALHRMSMGLNEEVLMDNFQWREYQNVLDKALSELTPSRREAFVLCREQGLSYEEAASKMGISKNTLKEHLTQSVKKIKSYLLENGEIALLYILLPHL